MGIESDRNSFLSFASMQHRGFFFSCRSVQQSFTLMYPGAATSESHLVHFHENMTFPLDNKSSPYKNSQMLREGEPKNGRPLFKRCWTMLVYKSLCGVGVSFPEVRLVLNGKSMGGPESGIQRQKMCQRPSWAQALTLNYLSLLWWMCVANLYRCIYTTRF